MQFDSAKNYLFDLNILKSIYDIAPLNICYIGANEGQELPDLMNCFPDSVIHCFEPQKKPFISLKNNYCKNENLKFYNFGLSNENKQTVIFKNNNNNNMSSSILEPKEHLSYHQNVTFDGFEKVKLKRFSDLNIDNVDFLNIDVQGYELEVLKGFDDLTNIKYIITEVNRKELYKNCVLINELDKYLNNYNFVRVKTIWWQMTVPWGDAFYIQKDLIKTSRIYFYKLINFLQGLKGYFFILSLLIKFKIVKVK